MYFGAFQCLLSLFRESPSSLSSVNSMVFWLYVVKGTSTYGDRWYVGCSEDPGLRLQQHSQGPDAGGAKWLSSCYKLAFAEPCREFMTKQEALDQEARRTAELMYIHGATQVRGGPFPYRLPSLNDLIAWLSHILDLPYNETRSRITPTLHCVRCHGEDHMVSMCHIDCSDTPEEVETKSAAVKHTEDETVQASTGGA
jgi:predicted GIY-YIG superfamily endonuclease